MIQSQNWLDYCMNTVVSGVRVEPFEVEGIEEFVEGCRDETLLRFFELEGACFPTTCGYQFVLCNSKTNIELLCPFVLKQ